MDCMPFTLCQKKKEFIQSLWNIRIFIYQACICVQWNSSWNVNKFTWIWLFSIAGSPFQFTVGPFGDSGSHLVKAGGSGLEFGEVGIPAEFNIWTREAGEGKIAISIEGPSKAEINFKDRKDGSCNVAYTVKEPGQYHVSLKVKNELESIDLVKQHKHIHILWWIVHFSLTIATFRIPRTLWNLLHLLLMHIKLKSPNSHKVSSNQIHQANF